MLLHAVRYDFNVISRGRDNNAESAGQSFVRPLRNYIVIRSSREIRARAKVCRGPLFRSVRAFRIEQHALRAGAHLPSTGLSSQFPSYARQWRDCYLIFVSYYYF